MIRGLRTAVYPVPNLAEAKAWYAKVLERTPYFDAPFYVGFSVGGFELGLIPDGEPGTAGVRVYWGADDAEAEVARLVDLGAEIFEALQEVGGNIRVAGLKDPFGNVFGVIENPSFKPGDVQ